MSTSTFNEKELQEDLSDVNVDATGVDASTVNKVKGWLKRGTNAIASLASRYSHRTGLGFSALKSYFTNRRYTLEPVNEPGVGGYFSPEDGRIVIDSEHAKHDEAFAFETGVHERWHNYRWLNGSMKRLGEGLHETFSYLGDFGGMIANYVQRIYEEMAATRLTQKAYQFMGIGNDVRGYPSLQPRLGEVEKRVGEERLFYNERRDAPLIAAAVLGALA